MEELKTWLKERDIDLDSLSPEDVSKHLNDFNAEKKAALEDAKKAASNAVEIATETKSLVEKQGEQIKELGNAMVEAVGKLSKGNVTVGKPVDEIYAQLDAQRESLKALSSTKSRDAKLSLTLPNDYLFKAAGSMSITGNVTGDVPQAERIAGINPIAQRTPVILGLFGDTGTISGNKLDWVYEANEDGGAGQTNEGAAKTQQDFDLLVGEESVKKTTSYLKITTEMLADIDGFRAYVDNKIRGKILQAVESGAWDGDGSGTGINGNLRGLTTVATTFAAPSLLANAVDNANEVDVLVAAILQVVLAEQERPDFAVVNPQVLALLKSTKVSATDKRYVERLVQVGDSLLVDGTTQIVESTLCAADDFLVGLRAKAMLRNKAQGLTIDVGLDGNDFTTNFRTILGEWRGLCAVENNDRTNFVTGSFTTAKAALQTA